MTTTNISQYKALIESFVRGKITAKEFEVAFLRMFKNERDPLPEEMFLVLDVLFSDVDAFCSDPGLRDFEDLDEQQLLHRADLALDELNSLLSKRSRAS